MLAIFIYMYIVYCGMDEKKKIDILYNDETRVLLMRGSVDELSEFIKFLSKVTGRLYDEFESSIEGKEIITVEDNIVITVISDNDTAEVMATDNPEQVEIHAF